MARAEAGAPGGRAAPDAYLPIEDHGVVGNLDTAALVGRDGSIDWCCLPELDDASVFAALLDARRGGRFRVAPAGGGLGAQRYLDGSNVLRTSFRAEGGRLVVTDFMPLRGSILGAGNPPTAPEVHRIAHCDEGEVEVAVEWSPRFDYARARTTLQRVPGGLVARGDDGARLSLSGLPVPGEVREEGGGPTLRARFRLRAGDRVALTCCHGAGPRRGGVEASRRALRETLDAWRAWTHQCEHEGACDFGGRWRHRVVRSGLALKLLTHPETGAIAAAATTSLPEHVGGVRNWDYRFSWIRDSSFTAQALCAIGHRDEAFDFLAWMAQASADRADGALQIVYGLHGETDLAERVLPHLEGYRASRPVRVGNGAARQLQLDVYGELLGAAYEFVRMGGRLSPRIMPFLASAADEAAAVWKQPDSGIWEVRGGPRQFVYSKVMIWVALDRAVRMAERFGLRGRVATWRREREAVRRAVLTHGFDPRLGAFVQSFGSAALDASNLLIPIVEFLPFDDPRVQGTIDRTLERLTRDGLVYRYVSGDSLPGGEGAFLLCTFWLVGALALSGRTSQAGEIFENVARRANHLGLYSEEIDPATGAFLGNFPQAFSHVGFINSALYLARAHGKRAPAPAPVGSRRHGEETGHHTAAKA